jgi:2-polyprenyl-3-methyl-5-hydroxy-6-metoxy-1,4-benzoquinol methylase
MGIAEGEPGTRSYFESLLEGRQRYAPWMAEALDYDGARDKQVLDVGCGQGIDLARFAAAGARVTGVDLTPRHVELARAHLAVMGLEGEVVEGDAEALPFCDQSFDRITSNGVLHHTPDLDSALAEIWRLLRPGGELRLIVYNKRSLYYWITQVLGHGLIQGRLFREGWDMGRVISHQEGGSRPGARPLVCMQTRSTLGARLKRNDLESISVEVRHFRFDDLPFTKPIAHLKPEWQHSPPMEWVGRKVGWYLVGVANRPAEY